MAWVAPTTRADGYTIDASEWNQNAVNNPIALRAGAMAIASQATGDLITASSATQLGRLADVATGQVLASGGVGAAPAYTANPSVATITTSGAATIGGLVDASGASAGQIKFPATQNASSNANTLDDYEEGTWTPVIGGSGGTSGQTYATQVGRYIKIGKLVLCWFNTVFSNKGTITTNVQIQGLPFTALNVTSLFGFAHVEWYSLATSIVFCSAQVQPNTTVATMTATTAAAAGLGAFDTTFLDNDAQFTGVVMYLADA